MKRLVRIAVILLASGTLLMFSAQSRLALLDAIQSFPRGKQGNLENEFQKAYMALGMAGIMMATGLALIIIAIARSRKLKKLANHG